MSRPRPGAMLLRTAGACALLVGLYYLVPVEQDIPQAQLWVRAGLCVLGVLAAGWLITRQIRRQVAGGGVEAPLTGLLMALVVGVLFFALMDYAVATATPGQFFGLRTRTDALYFAMSTLATVGFGDVHAQGQAARVVVIVQMLFNLVLVAAGGSVLVNQISARVRQRQAGQPRGDAGPPPG